MKCNIEELRSLVNEGASRAQVIALMKACELPIVEAIKMTIDVYNIGLDEANIAVANHPAYAQTAKASRPFQIEFYRQLEDNDGANNAT